MAAEKQAQYSYQGQRIKCERVKLGQGSFGQVYRGLFDDKIICAVKRIECEGKAEDAEDQEEKFLSKYQHANLLKLLHSEQTMDFK